MTAPIVAYSRDVLGFEPTPRQAEILDEVYRDGIRTAVLRLGRRSGKGRIAAVVATFEATANEQAHLDAVMPDEQVAIVVISRSQKLARVVHRYISGFLKQSGIVPVVRETLDEIELANGIVIMTLPCHAASVRGMAVAVVILDEAAHFAGIDGSPLDAGEVWDAIVPATAQFPAGRGLVLSTPRFATGWFADICAQASSGRFADMRHWHASTAEMNPRIPASFLEGESEKDPANYRREYLADFESGIGALFDEADVRECIRKFGDAILPPAYGRRYVIALDAAFTGDTFGAAIGHSDGPRIVVDRMTGWTGSKANPVQLDPTLDAVADLARAYNGAFVVIDQFAAQPILQGLQKRGLSVVQSPWTNDSKVSAATEVRRRLHSRSLEIPDDRRLITELLHLEQRPTPGGRPRIAAPSGQHDDYATALMALVAQLSGSVVTGDFSLVA